MAPSVNKEELVEAVRAELSRELEEADYNTDFDILRWLNENKFNLEDTVRRMRRHLQMRIAMDLKNIPPDSQRSRKFLMYYAGCKPQTTGMEGDNLVFAYLLHGKMDINGARKAMMPTQITTEILYDVERYLQLVRQMERETGQQWKTMIIFDFEDFKLDTSLVNGAITEMLQYLRSHFPGLIRKVVAVNAPAIAKVVVGMLQHIAPKDTEILVVPKREGLHQHVHPSRLPQALGGEMLEDGDPACPSLIRWPVAAKVKYLTLEVKEAGTRLHWFIQFRDKDDYSIGFYRSQSPDETDVNKMVRTGIQSLHYSLAKHPEYGEMVAREPGYYKIRLANDTSVVTTSKCEYVYEIKQTV